MKYVYKTRVTASQTDAGIGISTLGIAQVVQDNVCAFFACFNKDNVCLKRDYNSVWVFVKNRFKKTAIAYWNTEITVESYISKRSAALLIVDTVIKNSDGKVAVFARTEMCAVDLASGRIRRISSVGFPEDVEVYPSEADFEFNRFTFGGLKEKYSFTVPSTSVDYCMHLNNVESLRFILNTVPVSYGVLHPVRDVEIHFISQSREGDVLSVLAGRDETAEIFEIKNGENIAARCRIIRDDDYNA